MERLWSLKWYKQKSKLSEGKEEVDRNNQVKEEIEEILGKHQS